MATARAVILQKQIEGVLTDLMVRTNTQNVIMDDGKPLSSFLATLLTLPNVTAYVDERIDTVLNFNPGILTFLVSIQEILGDKADVVEGILAELATKAKASDVEAVSAAIGSLDSALGALTMRVAANEGAISNHGARLLAAENGLAQKSRVMMGETEPADLTERDLFLRIVSSAG